MLEWGEIRDWLEVNGYCPMPFVTSLLRTMSRAFVAMQQEASKENCPNPTKPEEAQKQRAEKQAEEDDPQPEPPRKRPLSSRTKMRG